MHSNFVERGPPRMALAISSSKSRYARLPSARRADDLKIVSHEGAIRLECLRGFGTDATLGAPVRYAAAPMGVLHVDAVPPFF